MSYCELLWDSMLRFQQGKVQGMGGAWGGQRGGGAYDWRECAGFQLALQSAFHVLNNSNDITDKIHWNGKTSFRHVYCNLPHQTWDSSKKKKKVPSPGPTISQPSRNSKQVVNWQGEPMALISMQHWDRLSFTPDVGCTMCVWSKPYVFEHHWRDWKERKKTLNELKPI